MSTPRQIKLCTKVGLAAAVLFHPGFIFSSSGAVTGQWDFEQGDLRATIGAQMEFLDGPEGTTAKGTTFGPTTRFGIPGIGGQEARVMAFPGMISPTMGFRVFHGASPNGEGDRVNEYTVILDLYFAPSSVEVFRSLFQTDNEGDGDFYLNPAGGVGVQGDYSGQVTTGAWHRVVIAVDLSHPTPVANKYVDGVRAGRQLLSQGRDERWSLGTSLQLFTDPAGESRSGYLSSLQVRDRALSDAEARLLGGPTASGIATNDRPLVSYLEKVTPPANAYGVPVTTGIQAEFQNGPTPLKWESIRMLVNRQLVVPQFSRSGSKTIVHYQPTPALIAKTNQIVLTYHDGVRTQTNSWEFVTTTNRPGRAVVGQWNFDQGDLRGSMGEAMRYLDGPAGASRRAVEFNSTTAFGIPDIGGSPAQVLHFAGAADPKIALMMPHRADPNGGESALRVNEWTLIVDLLVPNAQQEPWLALLQTDADNSSDTDVCIRFDAGRGGLGIRGAYEGEGGVMPGRWHRVAVAVDVGAVTMAKYIDGVLFAIQELPATELDGRYSLAPTILLFGDENGESQEAFVNSVQLRNYAMNEDEVHVLGSPTAKGIPTALPR